MADDKNGKRFAVVPDKESLAKTSDFIDCCVEDYAIPLRTGYSLKVVTDEIFSNIVYYSGAENAEILFRNDTDTITLIFVDDGMPYNPLETEDPDVTASAEERNIGGLGLFMVKKMAEDVQYEYTSGKNRLTVIVSKMPRKKKLSLEDFDI